MKSNQKKISKIRGIKRKAPRVNLNGWLARLYGGNVVDYKGWQIYFSDPYCRVNDFQKTYSIEARYFRTILRPQLKNAVPFLGHMTLQENCPFTICEKHYDPVKCLEALKELIDGIKEQLPRIIVDESQAR